MAKEKKGPDFTLPETIKVIRQGYSGPFIEIDGKMLPWLFTDAVVESTNAGKFPVVVLTLAAQRVLVVNDALEKTVRDRRDGEAMSAEAARLAEAEGESGE